MNKSFKLGLALLSSLCFFSSCQDASLEPMGEERGIGDFQDFHVAYSERVALIPVSEYNNGKIKELNYGLIDAHYITLSGNTYMVSWNDLKDFKGLLKNDKVHFRADEFLAREEKTGRVYRVIKLNEL